MHEMLSLDKTFDSLQGFQLASTSVLETAKNASYCQRTCDRRSFYTVVSRFQKIASLKEKAPRPSMQKHHFRLENNTNTQIQILRNKIS